MIKIDNLIFSYRFYLYMSPMSFAELKAFDAVARHLSFVRAAEELGRTQPTLTMQVSQLERSYGAELIIRNRGKIRSLTPLGQSLLKITRTMFALERDAYELLRDTGALTGGEVRLIATSPIMIIRLTKAFNTRFPNVACRLTFGNSEEVLKSILDCEADLGILGGAVHHEECLTLPVAKPEIVLVGHKDYLKGKPSVLSREDFSKETLLIREVGSETRELLMEKANKHNYRPKRTMEIGRRSGVLAAAKAGMGLAAVSEHEIDDNPALRIVRLKSFRVFGVNHAVCLNSRSRTPIIKELLSCFGPSFSQQNGSRMGSFSD
ncbi:LysR substrate-binding domain-containing protein [Nitratireductor kimnyeongensis]|uniref:LysR substrate-binding domain-containing protein n=1 Tax=Nitratireductor kimnyeongensis TaxID=430679 RepID=A0ABW0T6P8_9HYPH|nr:LysR substrate-binding domain-containing protein [Nitratireductor kimnyeongensis]QZZ36462.1 LysR family transcriptional regulator [Nitratireductor kimnyeongensis]